MKKLAVILLAMLLCCSSALATETDLSAFTTEQLQAELERRENEGRPMEIYKYLYSAYRDKGYFQGDSREETLYERAEGYSEIDIGWGTLFYFGDFGYRVDAYIRSSGERTRVLISLDDIPEFIKIFARACLEDETYPAIDQALSELNTNPGITVPGDKVTSTAQVGEHTLTLVLSITDNGLYYLTFTVS
ncbi:MAG: hypothetical protein RR150_09500 [Clostridia bacterium]